MSFGSEYDAGSSYASPQSEGNIIMAFVFGFVAMLVCAIIWGVLTIVTGYQLGLLALGIGFVIGIAVQFGGRDATPTFGIIAGGLSLLAIIFGNIIHLASVLSQHAGEIGVDEMSFFGALAALLTNPGLLVELLVATFSPMDIVFYAIALWLGFRYGSGGGGGK